jgi:hypothetical protein
MEELIVQLDKLNLYVTSKKDLLNDIHNKGRIEEKYRKAFEKSVNEQIFTNNEIRKILTYFKVANFILKYEKEIISNVKSAKIEINGILNTNSKEREIIDLISRFSISLSHISKFIETDLDQVNLTEQESITLLKFALINPNEIIIDIIDWQASRVKNASEVLTVEFMRQLLDIINKYSLIDRLYSVFFYIIQITLTNQLVLFIDKYKLDLSNIKIYDKKNVHILELISNVKTNNTFLLVLMRSNPNEYKSLIMHLMSDKDFDGKYKEIQIEDKTFATFNWIAFESRNLHIQKIISILVLCSMKNWFTKKWSDISSSDKVNIIKNTFGLTINHQNFHPDKIKKIENDISSVNEKGIDSDKSLKYLSFLECFMKKGEFIQKLR